MERTQMELRPKAGSQESINFPLCSNLVFFQVITMEALQHTSTIVHKFT